MATASEVVVDSGASSVPPCSSSGSSSLMHVFLIPRHRSLMFAPGLGGVTVVIRSRALTIAVVACPPPLGWSDVMRSRALGLSDVMR